MRKYTCEGFCQPFVTTQKDLTVYPMCLIASSFPFLNLKLYEIINFPKVFKQITQILEWPDSFCLSSSGLPTFRRQKPNFVEHMQVCFPGGKPCSSEGGAETAARLHPSFTLSRMCPTCILHFTWSGFPSAAHRPVMPDAVWLPDVCEPPRVAGCPACRCRLLLSYVASEPCWTADSWRSMKHFFVASSGIGLWTFEWMLVHFCALQACISFNFCLFLYWTKHKAQPFKVIQELWRSLRIFSGNWYLYLTAWFLLDTLVKPDLRHLDKSWCECWKLWLVCLDCCFVFK